MEVSRSWSVFFLRRLFFRGMYELNMRILESIYGAWRHQAFTPSTNYQSSNERNKTGIKGRKTVSDTRKEIKRQWK